MRRGVSRERGEREENLRSRAAERSARKQRSVLAAAAAAAAESLLFSYLRLANNGAKKQKTKDGLFISFHCFRAGERAVAGRGFLFPFANVSLRQKVRYTQRRHKPTLSLSPSQAFQRRGNIPSTMRSWMLPLMLQPIVYSSSFRWLYETTSHKH